MGILDKIGTGEYQLPDRLDASRTDLRDEFMADPLGRHSLDLQLLLGLMRGSPLLPRWVLLVRRPGESWVLAEARPRGEPPKIVPGTVFTSLADAERHVFDLRWRALAELATTQSAPLAHQTSAANQPPVPDQRPVPFQPSAAHQPSAAEQPPPTPLLPQASQITGYCDPLSAAPGEQVRFFVSCEPGIDGYDAELVRIRSAAPGGPAGEPECDPVDGGCSGRYPARTQPVHPGSYVEIPGGGKALAGQVTVVLLVQPSFRPGRQQVLLSCADPQSGAGLALMLDPQLRPTLVAGPAAQDMLTCPAALPTGAWSVISATFGGGHDATLTAGLLTEDVTSWPSATRPAAIRLPGGPLQATWPGDSAAGEDEAAASQDEAAAGQTGAARQHDPDAASMVLGAVLSGDGRPELPFSGRLESPVILAGQISAEQARALMAAGPASAVATGQARAGWDFSIGIGTWTITDCGPDGLHGAAFNLPMRAVRGARWTGRHDDWQEAPGEYAALHFLADALEDCRWDADFSWTVPPDAPSGFYAARLSSGQHTEHIPLFVRPAPGATPAPVLLIAPAATYAAYGNSRFWWENPVQELVQDRLVEVSAEEQHLMLHPELGASSYDCHLDGTDVCYVSRLRPNLNMRPGHVRQEGYPSDLALVAWLDRTGVRYDVVTDEDVHLGGGELLSRYPVVLTGTHPEYMSARIFDAILGWAGHGGRLMYLGGNGFSMNVSFDASRPWIMENRRVELWERDEGFQRSEAVHSTDGLRGGYLAASGRQAADITGVESATMGFDRSYPYRLTDAARRPESAFVFEGVAGPVIGAFGAIGGGVVGQEWDNSSGRRTGPGHLILASSADHSLVVPMFGAVRPDYHADLVLYLRGAGAAFAVSSMAWCAALSHNSYANEIETITRNVLLRFADPAPFGEGAPG